MKNPTLLLNTTSSNLEETIQHCASVIFKSTKYLGNGISVITTLETSPLITGIAKQQSPLGALYAADVVMHHKHAMLRYLMKCSTTPFPSAGSQEDFPSHMIN